jgi:acyl carrier protein
LSERDSHPTVRPERVEVERRVTAVLRAAFAISKKEIEAESFALTNAKTFSSFSLLELILRLENAFQIQIPDEQLDRDRFNTLSSITDYIEQRLAETDC